MISCKNYAEFRKSLIQREVSGFNSSPHLVVIRIGDDNASESYVKGKKKDCEEVGIKIKEVHIEDDSKTNEEIASIIRDFDSHKKVDGIIIQLPIPDKYDVEQLQKCISKEKDVDGFRRDSCFKPCTPKGIIDYLKANNIDFAGKNVVVIGRSKIVGKPLVNMLIGEGSTVTCCNSKTKDIKLFTLQADIVVSAIGQAQFFDESYFKYGQIIVDVGINKDENGKLCGDVCREVADKAKLLTPVPGGVGLLTRVSLLENVIEAYKLKNEKKEKFNYEQRNS